MRKTPAAFLLAVALVAAGPIAFAVETINYNGATYRCQNSCNVSNGQVTDSQGGSVTRIAYAHTSQAQ